MNYKTPNSFMSFISPQHWRGKDASHITLDQQLVGSLSKKRKFSLRQLKYLHRILTRREYRIIQILGIILIINGVFLSWKAYDRLTVVTPQYGGTYSEGLVGSPSTINPLFLHRNDSDRDLALLVYSGLMRYTPDRDLVADLAESVERSEDNKTYTVRLRRDVTWHDGEKFDADDVIFTLARAQDPATKSPLYASYKDIVVKKEDAYTISFTLEKPFAPFLDLLTLLILPEHLWRDFSSDQLALTILNVKPVGTGPWKFRSLQKEKDGTLRSLTLSRNEEFYGARPYLERLVFKFYPDIRSAVQGLKNRHIQGVSFVPRDMRESLARDEGLASYHVTLPQYTALFINLGGKKELQSRDVRAALAQAIDKERLVAEGLGGEATVIHSSISEGLLGYHPALSPVAYEPERAREFFEKQDTPLSLELSTADTPERAQIAEMVKEMWEHVGVSVAITYEPTGTMRELVLNPRKYDILLYGAVVGSDPDLYPFWHSSQAQAPGLNLSQYRNTDTDTLLERARITPDREKRAELYRTFQESIARDVPAIFLYTPTYTNVMTRDIKGLRDRKRIGYPADRFGDLAQWYSKSKRQFR